MMNITAKAMHELATVTCRKEVDDMLLKIETLIAARAANGHSDTSVNLQNVKMCAYEIIKNELQEAGFKINCGQDKWINIQW